VWDGVEWCASCGKGGIRFWVVCEGVTVRVCCQSSLGWDDGLYIPNTVLPFLSTLPVENLGPECRRYTRLHGLVIYASALLALVFHQGGILRRSAYRRCGEYL
jgi:hypothetical protein